MRHILFTAILVGTATAVFAQPAPSNSQDEAAIRKVISAFPGAPPWLALVVGLTPGVVAATGLTLADSLALGLTLVAFAATMHRRPRADEP